MNLHQDKIHFAAAILATSDKLKLPPVFIEKDYWITLVLKRLSQSKYNEKVVFKGGTSLSKGFRLIVGRIQRSGKPPVIFDYRDLRIDYFDRMFKQRNRYYKKMMV